MPENISIGLWTKRSVRVASPIRRRQGLLPVYLCRGTPETVASKTDNFQNLRSIGSGGIDKCDIPGEISQLWKKNCLVKSRDSWHPGKLSLAKSLRQTHERSDVGSQ